jgi:hypothetical protein
MALRYAVASGNWSNTATWNGGTLPTASDDVYANGLTVTVNQNVNILSLRSTAGAPAVAGGSFQTLIAGYVITMTGAGLVCGGTTAGVVGLNAVGASTTIIGIVTGGVSASFFAVNIPITSVGANLTVIGNVLSGASSTSYAINNLTGSNTISITGNVTAIGAVCIRNTIAGSTVNVTGNVLGGTALAAAGISVIGTSPVSVTGNCTASAGPAVLTTAATSPISCIGTVTAANTYGITSLGTVTISTPCISSATNNAISSVSTRIFASAAATCTFKNESGGNKVLYSAGVPLGNPALADVRLGTTYGASSELTGTLAVPSPSNVVSGVPTDNTVGTYTNTPAAISTELFTKLLSHSDFSTTDSFGKLVKDNLDAKSSDIKKNTDLIPAAV